MHLRAERPHVVGEHLAGNFPSSHKWIRFERRQRGLPRAIDGGTNCQPFVLLYLQQQFTHGCRSTSDFARRHSGARNVARQLYRVACVEVLESTVVADGEGNGHL